MNFKEIYETVDMKAEPPLRSIFQIKTILEKAYEVAENPFFSPTSIFDALENTPLAIHRTTAKRMILEIEQLEGASGFSTIASQSLEASIIEVYIADKYVNDKVKGKALDVEEAMLSGRMRATVRYLIDCARTGVVLTKKQHMREHLETIEKAEDKVKWLKKMMLTYEQVKASTDKNQYEMLFDFMKLEKKKWKMDTQNLKPEQVNSHSISVGAGGIVNVSHGERAVQATNTGAGAQQNIASGETVNQGIGGTPAASIDELLKQLAHLITTDEAFTATRQEMEQQLETVKVQLNKPEPKKSIIKRAFESITELAADGAGVMAGHAVFELLHQAPALLAAVGLG